MKWQLDLTIALRTQCQIHSNFPCTYYVESNYRKVHENLDCKVTCCYACKERKVCGWACNASKKKEEVEK